MITLKNLYDIEDEVYLKTDPEQELRIVTAINVRLASKDVYYLSYELSCGSFTSWHTTGEISTDKNPAML